VYDVAGLVNDPALLANLRASLSGFGPPGPLRCAKVKITSRCNLRCAMCRYWSKEREETLPTRRWHGIISELAGLGCRKIHFSGGEVLLREDFLDLAEATAAQDIHVNFTTNGTLLEKDVARRIRRIGTHSVSVSLDGPTGRLHDRLRGAEHAFRKAVRAIRWLTADRGRLTVRINTVILRENFRRLPQVIRLAGELGVDEWVPLVVDEKGPRHHRLSEEEIREYNRDIAPQVLELQRRYGFSTHLSAVYPFGVTGQEIAYASRGQYAGDPPRRWPCLAPWLHMCVSWDGGVYLCCMTRGRMPPLGNLGRESAAEVFWGPAYRQIREDFLAGRMPEACRRCRLFPRENALLHAALNQVDDGLRPVRRMRMGVNGPTQEPAQPRLELGGCAGDGPAAHTPPLVVVRASLREEDGRDAGSANLVEGVIAARSYDRIRTGQIRGGREEPQRARQFVADEAESGVQSPRDLPEEPPEAGLLFDRPAP
jgi:MoaA/NifB/PqqE/SkfB family radical SAM enzyme